MSDFHGPVFLVGMPRSGTKLLRDLLNRHPRVNIPDVETEFLPWLVHRAGRFGDLSERSQFEKMYRQLARQSFFTYRAAMGREISADTWYKTCVRFDISGIFEALVRVDVGAPVGADIVWGDKSPSYIDDLPLIAQLYPRARILHIVRDVRDHCVSLNHAWGKDMRRAAQRWALGVTAARRHGAALGSRYEEVRYEDLIRDPESTLKRVCSFLAVDFRAEMLLLTRPSESLGHASGARHVVADNHGKFIERMKAATLADVEQIAGQAMREFGYQPVMPARPPRSLMQLRLYLAQVHDALQLILHREPGQSLLSAMVFHLRYFVTTRG